MKQKKIQFSDVNPFIRYVQLLKIELETYPVSRWVCPYDCRLFYVTEGRGTLHFKNQEPIEIERGHVVLWMSGMDYFMQSREEDPMILLGVNFDYTQDFSRFTLPIPPDPLNIFDADRILEQVEFTDFPRMNRLVHLRNMQSIEGDLRKMLREYAAQKTLCVNYLSNSFANILVLICRNISLSDSARNVSAEKMETVLKYIHEHYAEDLNNGYLGSHFGYHSNYLNRQIKIYTGKTLHQYLLFYRVGRAIDLLISTSYSITEIAVMVGFRDLYHFSKVFKQKTGLTPCELRSSGYNLKTEDI